MEPFNYCHLYSSSVAIIYFIYLFIQDVFQEGGSIQIYQLR